jgi:uncharacterized protein (TIGR03086 family)
LPILELEPVTTHLSVLIQDVPDSALDRPTPCSDYCVGDLLDHIAGLTIAFGGAAVKADGDSATMGPMGDASNLDPDWRGSIPQRLEGLSEAWLDPNAWTGMTRVGGQELPGEVAGVVLFGELAVHGWDLARANGMTFAPDPAGLPTLLELVGNFFGPGQEAARGAAFGPAVPVPEDAPMFDRVLGLLGRDPTWSPRLPPGH